MSGQISPTKRGVAPALTILLVAFATWMLTNMDQSLFGYAVPDIVRSFGLSIDSIGLLISASFVAGIFGAALGGMATDVWGARRTLPVCLGISALLVGLQGFAGSAATFALLRIVGYTFSAALAPICNAMVGNISRSDRRPMMIAILQCGYPLGWAIASFAATPLIATGGWRAPFLLGFVVVPIAGLFYWLLPAQGRTQTASAPLIEAPKGRASPLATLLREHRLKTIVGTMIFFLYGGSVAGTIFYLPAFFRETRGYDAITAAHIVGLSWGVSMAGYIGAALVGQTLLSRRSTTILWMLLALVLMLVMIWLPRSVTQDVVAFSAAAIFFFGTAAISTAYLLEIFPENLRGTASGLCGSGGLCAGSVVFPLMVARLSQVAGWQVALSASVAPLAIAAGLLLLLPKRG
jgi:SHS family lactate transporter-like MFS transporter